MNYKLFLNQFFHRIRFLRFRRRGAIVRLPPGFCVCVRKVQPIRGCSYCAVDVMVKCWKIV